MSIYNQLEILRSTKIALNSSIESLGEDLTNKIFGDYSDSVTNVLTFLQQIEATLDELIETLTLSQSSLIALDSFMGIETTLTEKILDPVED